MYVLGIKTSNNKRRAILAAIIEGRKMESYAEHQTKEMHVCWLCDTICYKKRVGKKIGQRWICIECMRQLKEALDTFKQWDEEVALQNEMKKQLEESLARQQSKG